MTDRASVFENENYIVVVSEDLELSLLGNVYLGGYEVINKASGVTEYMTTSMPEAMFNAEQLHGALVSEAWKWRREVKEDKASNPLRDALN